MNRSCRTPPALRAMRQTRPRCSGGSRSTASIQADAGRCCPTAGLFMLRRDTGRSSIFMPPLRSPRQGTRPELARSREQYRLVPRRQTGPARAARVVTLSALRAVHAFMAGAYAEVRDILRGLQPALERIGGSHAQHELFGRMFTEAGRRLRSADLVECPVWGCCSLIAVEPSLQRLRSRYRAATESNRAATPPSPHHLLRRLHFRSYAKSRVEHRTHA